MPVIILRASILWIEAIVETTGLIVPVLIFISFEQLYSSGIKQARQAVSFLITQTWPQNSSTPPWIKVFPVLTAVSDKINFE